MFPMSYTANMFYILLDNPNVISIKVLGTHTSITNHFEFIFLEPTLLKMDFNSAGLKTWHFESGLDIEK